MTAQMIRSAADIHRRFPHIPDAKIAEIAEFEKRFRFGISEEMLDYLHTDRHGVPLASDPLARPYWPFPKLLTAPAPNAFDPAWDNWEDAESEFPIPGNWAWHQKYGDKAKRKARIVNRTFGCEQYCQHCFEAERVLDKDTFKKPRKNDWPEGVEYIRVHPEIDEVIFSGGEPLIVPNHLLARRLTDIRSCPNVRTIRIHTAKGVHDTDRLDDEFASLCAQFAVTAIAFHILHPRQVTARFAAAMGRLAHGCGSTIRLAHIPILRDVNNDTETLKELCTKLVEVGVKPYYALHSMPSTLGAKEWRLPVREMVEAMRPLVGRAFAHMRCPEPVIVSRGGKRTIPMEHARFWLCRSQVQELVWAIDDTHQPLEMFALRQEGDMFEFDGTIDFLYARYDERPVIVFRNWKGEWEMYPDAE